MSRSPAGPGQTATIGRLRSLDDGLLYPIGLHPLVIGRAPQCDLHLTSEDVSRQHAYVLRTPTGHLIIDSSTHGVYVDGERVEGQQLLAEGDVIEIGGRRFEFELVAESERAPRAGPDPTTVCPIVRPNAGWRHTGKFAIARNLPARQGGKLVEWIRRYWPAELAGIGAAIAGYSLTKGLTGSGLMAAVAASAMEGVGFYGVVVVHALIRDAYAAGSRRAEFGLRQMGGTWRNLFIQFGAAELLDSGLLRPCAIALATTYLGQELGVAAGKLVADGAWYGPVVLMSAIGEHRIWGGGFHFRG